MKRRKCFFCKKVKPTFEVGIAFGIRGKDYRFCLDCLRDMTALELWEKIFISAKLLWPPKEGRTWRCEDS